MVVSFLCDGRCMFFDGCWCVNRESCDVVAFTKLSATRLRREITSIMHSFGFHCISNGQNGRDASIAKLEMSVG